MMKTTKKLKNSTPKANGAATEPLKSAPIKAEPAKAVLTPTAPAIGIAARPEPVKTLSVKPEPPKPAAIKPEAPKPLEVKTQPGPVVAAKPEAPKPVAFKPEAPKPLEVKHAPAPVVAVKPEPAKPAPVKIEPPAINRVALHLEKPGAKSVSVAGSFNGWNPAKTPLKDAGNGKWVGELTGISGRHEYMFVVDGQWLPDPNAKESVQNPFGGRNSVLVVSA